MMQAILFPWGKLSIDDDGLHVRGLFSSEEIPYSRISSVAVDGMQRKIKVETGAQMRTYQLWSWRPGKAQELGAAIREHISAQ